MPDHLHLLVVGGSEDCDLVGFATTFRRRATSDCEAGLRPLWQDGYHDQVLRDHDHSERVIDYILNNPVRAGLVQRAADYQGSWSVTPAAALEVAPPFR